MLLALAQDRTRMIVMLLEILKMEHILVQVNRKLRAVRLNVAACWRYFPDLLLSKLHMLWKQLSVSFFYANQIRERVCDVISHTKIRHQGNESVKQTGIA